MGLDQANNLLNCKGNIQQGEEKPAEWNRTFANYATDK